MIVPTTFVPGPQTESELQAEESGRRVSAMSIQAARNAIAALTDEPWVRETVEHLGLACLEPLGLYHMVGPDETPWPAAMVAVKRTPWRYGQERTRMIAAVYVIGGAMAVSMMEPEQLDESRRIGPLPLMVRPELPPPPVFVSHASASQEPGV